jgi:hypothetical protein
MNKTLITFLALSFTLTACSGSESAQQAQVTPESVTTAAESTRPASPVPSITEESITAAELICNAIYKIEYVPTDFDTTNGDVIKGYLEYIATAIPAVQQAQLVYDEEKSRLDTLGEDATFFGLSGFLTLLERAMGRWQRALEREPNDVMGAEDKAYSIEETIDNVTDRCLY